jgi:hypothetical protein
MEKYCKFCGALLSEGSNFCENCGSAVSKKSIIEPTGDDFHEDSSSIGPEEAYAKSTEKPSPNIRLGEDGKLRWVYEFSLYKNPTILFLIWKIFFYIFLGMFGLMLLVQMGDGLLEAFTGIAPVFLYMNIGMLVLSTIAYYIYAMLMGGKYCVIFEMDKKGINHIQMQKQFEKAKLIGIIGAMTGVVTGNIGATGTGILAGTKQATYSKFKLVKSVKVNRKRGVIKVNSKDMIHNQVYAEEVDFDFVLNYIMANIPTGKGIQ